MKGEIDVGVGEHRSFSFPVDLFIDYLQAFKPSLTLFIVVVLIRVFICQRRMHFQLTFFLSIFYLQLSRHEFAFSAYFTLHWYFTLQQDSRIHSRLQESMVV